MPTQVLGSDSFLVTPDVNGVLVMLNGGGNAVITSGTTGARPAFGNTGNLYVDTTVNGIYRDTGAAWVLLIPATSGHVLQVVTGNIPATTGTTQITTAVTATPTITDGFQIWATSFTPVSASSKILISFTTSASHGNATRTVITSCFAGNTNMGSVANNYPTANLPVPISFECVYSPGSTATITISCRTGATGAGTLSISQYNGTTNTLGGAAVTEYSIMEII